MNKKTQKFQNKKINKFQLLKETNKTLLSFRVSLIFPVLFAIILLFSNGITFTGYYSIQEETDQSKTDYIVDFGDEANKGVTLFNIIYGNNITQIIDTELTSSGTTKTENILILCPTVPGLLPAGIALVVGLILGLCLFSKKANVNIILLIISAVLIIGSLTFIMFKIIELKTEYLELTRFSTLQQIAGSYNHDVYTSSVESHFSYQFILLGIVLIIDVILKIATAYYYNVQKNLLKTK